MDTENVRERMRAYCRGVSTYDSRDELYDDIGSLLAARDIQWQDDKSIEYPRDEARVLMAANPGTVWEPKHTEYNALRLMEVNGHIRTLTYTGSKRLPRAQYRCVGCKDCYPDAPAGEECERCGRPLDPYPHYYQFVGHSPPRMLLYVRCDRSDRAAWAIRSDGAEHGLVAHEKYYAGHVSYTRITAKKVRELREEAQEHLLSADVAQRIIDAGGSVEKMPTLAKCDTMPYRLDGGSIQWQRSDGEWAKSAYASLMDAEKNQNGGVDGWRVVELGTRLFVHKWNGTCLFLRCEPDLNGHVSVRPDGATKRRDNDIEDGIDRWNRLHDLDRMPDWHEITGYLTEQEILSGAGRKRCARCEGAGDVDNQFRPIACPRCDGTGEEPKETRELHEDALWPRLFCFRGRYVVQVWICRSPNAPAQVWFGGAWRDVKDDTTVSWFASRDDHIELTGLITEEELVAGAGRERCSRCEGEGELCIVCRHGVVGGDGRKSQCPDWDEQKDPCPRCEGTGEEPVRDCRAPQEARERCAWCGGRQPGEHSFGHICACCHGTGEEPESEAEVIEEWLETLGFYSGSKSHDREQ